MRVNEIFYSLQGEGFFTGQPGVFVRLAGCNLRCSFCDTEFEQYTTLSLEAVAKAISDYPSKHLIFTGGEPALQLRQETVTFFKQLGYTIQVETNGTHPLPAHHIDWVTCSPKTAYCPDADIRLQHIDEVKVVFDGRTPVDQFLQLPAKHHFLQPCDTGNPEENARITQACVQHILQHPQWRLSLQTHKLIHIP